MNVGDLGRRSFGRNTDGASRCRPTVTRAGAGRDQSQGEFFRCY